MNGASWCDWSFAGERKGTGLPNFPSVCWGGVVNDTGQQMVSGELLRHCRSYCKHVGEQNQDADSSLSQLIVTRRLEWNSALPEHECLGMWQSAGCQMYLGRVLQHSSGMVVGSSEVQNREHDMPSQPSFTTRGLRTWSYWSCAVQLQDQCRS